LTLRASALRIAAEVKDFDPTHYVDKKDARRMDRFVHFAVAATSEALRQAHLTSTAQTRKRSGCIHRQRHWRPGNAF